MAELTIKDLLGIDFDDKGLAETIDSVTLTFNEMEAVHDAIGRAIFLDGGLLDDERTFNVLEVIKDVVCNDDRVMNMLCYYASRSEEFMKRL